MAKWIVVSKPDYDTELLEGDKVVATLSGYTPDALDLIVRAVNRHVELLETLKTIRTMADVRKFRDRFDIWLEADKALTKAEGGK